MIESRAAAGFPQVAACVEAGVSTRLSSAYGTLRRGIYLINWRYPDSRGQQIREETIQIKLFR
ncbi:hypothetical protein LGM35_30105 [Burkholderia cenocepacia]|uniref:hypothetical protein n=1 Tax=Burkholderia cenocepacia TaxID=95486 RepID=UPI001CF34B32|nr:hypothetical protein [Burkholderia cenocepacia]MCA7926779.1 hypothetical protein [Burkholderia cenocepacia]